MSEPMPRTPFPRAWTRSAPGFLSLAIGTGLGSGLSPRAPGTMGSLVGVAALWAVRDFSWGLKLACILALTAIGTWAARSVCAAVRSRDDQRIVIDEVIGMMLTGFTLAPNFWNYALAFLFFRFFDILKLPPARQADRWSKSLDFNASWQIGFGVILDDIFAGLQGLAILYALQALGLLA